MIRPTYMICCEGRIVDRDSGMVSYYNVIEEVMVTAQRSAEPRVPPPSLKFVVIAVWMNEREEAEESQQTYEFQTRMFVPGEEEPRVLHTGEFHFGGFRYHRLEVFFRGLPVIGSPPDALQQGIVLREGVLRFESRVRQRGAADWLSQEYLVPVKVTPAQRPHTGNAEPHST